MDGQSVEMILQEVVCLFHFFKQVVRSKGILITLKQVGFLVQNKILVMVLESKVNETLEEFKLINQAR